MEKQIKLEGGKVAEETKSGILLSKIRGVSMTSMHNFQNAQSITLT